VQTRSFESLILYVQNLAETRAFYADALGLPVLFEDEIVVVVGDQAGRVVLHRNDRGHDEGGIFPAGSGVGGAAVRFAVDDPDACERNARAQALTVPGRPKKQPGDGSSSWPIPTAGPSYSRS